MGSTWFPSPVGELHFSIFFSPFIDRCFFFDFRPLSGNYISQSMLRRWMICIRRFPSPVGELHFSMCTPSSNCPSSVLKFPSPVGELHFSMKTLQSNKIRTWFPSPVGELHFSMATRKMLWKRKIISVPCRGTTFLNVCDKISALEESINDFRPLSGNYISQFVPVFAGMDSMVADNFRPLSGNYISQ